MSKKLDYYLESGRAKYKTKEPLSEIEIKALKYFAREIQETQIESYKRFFDDHFDLPKPSDILLDLDNKLPSDVSQLIPWDLGHAQIFNKKIMNPYILKKDYYNKFIKCNNLNPPLNAYIDDYLKAAYAIAILDYNQNDILPLLKTSTITMATETIDKNKVNKEAKSLALTYCDRSIELLMLEYYNRISQLYIDKGYSIDESNASDIRIKKSAEKIDFKHPLNFVKTDDYSSAYGSTKIMEKSKKTVKLTQKEKIGKTAQQQTTLLSIKKSKTYSKKVIDDLSLTLIKSGIYALKDAELTLAMEYRKRYVYGTIKYILEEKQHTTLTKALCKYPKIEIHMDEITKYIRKEYKCFSKKTTIKDLVFYMKFIQNKNEFRNYLFSRIPTYFGCQFADNEVDLIRDMLHYMKGRHKFNYIDLNVNRSARSKQKSDKSISTTFKRFTKLIKSGPKLSTKENKFIYKYCIDRSDFIKDKLYMKTDADNILVRLYLKRFFDKYSLVNLTKLDYSIFSFLESLTEATIKNNLQTLWDYAKK